MMFARAIIHLRNFGRFLSSASSLNRVGTASKIHTRSTASVELMLSSESRIPE